MLGSMVGVAHFITGYAHSINPIALRKAKIVYNFGLFECNRVKLNLLFPFLWDILCFQECNSSELI